MFVVRSLSSLTCQTPQKADSVHTDTNEEEDDDLQNPPDRYLATEQRARDYKDQNAS